MRCGRSHGAALLSAGQILGDYPGGFAVCSRAVLRRDWRRRCEAVRSIERLRWFGGRNNSAFYRAAFNAHILRNLFGSSENQRKNGGEISAVCSFSAVWICLYNFVDVKGKHMKLLKNRTVLGVVCIALSLIICFAITPLFNAAKENTTEIVRMKKDVKIGQEITEKDVEIVEVGAYNLPADVLKKSEDVVGKYVSSELLAGEYVLPGKISNTPASENAYLYNLTGEKRAISVTIPSFAGGLSGKIISGDIVSVIAVDYRESGETVVPDELQYVEVIAVTDKEGYDEDEVVVTTDGEEEPDLPETVTLLVTPAQANILAELEADGEIHLSLVYRGTSENAQKFIAAQEKLLNELAEAEKAEEEKSEIPTVPTVSEPALPNEIPTENEEKYPVIDTVIIETPETLTTEETEVTADG